jgi:hypothetical protein
MDIQKLNLTLADIEAQLLHRIRNAEAELSEMVDPEDETEEGEEEEEEDYRECDCASDEECDCDD